MTTPRRTRRRNVPAASLPRLSPSGTEDTPEGRSAARVQLGHRQHHVLTDYSYVHKDLLTVAAVGLVVIAFIVGMSFVV